MLEPAQRAADDLQTKGLVFSSAEILNSPADRNERSIAAVSPDIEKFDSHAEQFKPKPSSKHTPQTKPSRGPGKKKSRRIFNEFDTTEQR